MRNAVTGRQWLTARRRLSSERLAHRDSCLSPPAFRATPQALSRASSDTHSPPPPAAAQALGMWAGRVEGGCHSNRRAWFAPSAICVRKFDDSHDAIHTTYRISLRSSSLREPRHPLLRVVLAFGSSRRGCALVVFSTGLHALVGLLRTIQFAGVGMERC